MSEWGIARKKPIEVQFREVQKDTLLVILPKWLGGKEVWGEVIETREGKLNGHVGDDYIIKGVDGELYPIKKDIFERTYDVIKIPVCEHKWEFKPYCGCYVCELCGAHAHLNEATGEVVQYLASCYCGWRSKT